MSKGSSILLAIVMAIGGFSLGHVVGSRSGTDVADGDGEEAQAADVKLADDVQRYKVPVTSAQPSKGPKDALITIVEFSEFQCPFCARVLPTTKEITDTYGDKVRIVWRNNPLAFHNNAAPAAAVAMEAFAQGGSDKFWEVHDVLFANQKALTRPQLEEYAQKAGLKAEGVKKALDGAPTPRRSPPTRHWHPPSVQTAHPTSSSTGESCEARCRLLRSSPSSTKKSPPPKRS